MVDHLQRQDVGIVVIGRNEGERLRRCLESVISFQPTKLVYVDSGSVDGSVDLAVALGVDVVALCSARPFTAARGRNAGFRRIAAQYDDVTYVQFVDGDCELETKWLEKACAFLDTHPEVALVSGRLRERFPHMSWYNRLCDMEWDRAPGETDTSGGIALVRAFAFEGIGGFRKELIAGEEPELCLRLRGKNWKIWRLGVEMATHEADITRFAQWWRRTMRGGHAYVERLWLHKGSEERNGLRETLRALFWGFGLPVFSVLASFVNPTFILLLGLYPLQVVRIAAGRNLRQLDSWRYAVFASLGKFAEALGILKFVLLKLTNRQPHIIEYKN